MATGFLERSSYAQVGPDPTRPRSRSIRLTQKGKSSFRRYEEIIAGTESGWRQSVGSDLVDTLRQSVGELVDDHDRLFEGMEPYPDGWRSKVRPPKVLPQYPMVLHRGGYPDGS